MKRLGWTALTALVAFGSWTQEAQADPELVGAFAFGSRLLDCPTQNEPSVSYTMVYHGTVGELAYDSGRGWGYEVVDPGASGYAVFGPFDDSPNSRNRFADSCPHELYDSFIGAKNFSSPCPDDPSPCLPPEGIIFRVDLPNGKYRFVAAVGEAENPHTHRIVVEDGGSGPPTNLGASHVVLVNNHDQVLYGPGVFARVGFDGLLPPEAAVDGFVNMDEDGLETAGPPSSPTLEVTQGYLRLHQLKGATAGGDPNGGDMVIFEIWRVDESFNAIQSGSDWRYFPGTEEASTPNTGAWRTLAFDDSAWSTGAAPIGYGEPEIVTDLGSLAPPMSGNYTTVFLRQTFQVPDPAFVNQLIASVDYDDGFALWINGIELMRYNVDGLEGDPVAYDDLASASHESGLYEDTFLPDPSGYLVAGTNVVAVQVFNQSLTSTDLKFDLHLYDPVAPDFNPPEVSSIVPAPGTTVRSLARVEVTFTEEVTGVEAADLLVNGLPASTVTGTEKGPYIFSFIEPAAGPVPVEWDAAHGITDVAEFPNPFGGGSWSYTVDPDAPVGDLIINEVLAVNVDGLRDENGEPSDWFEVYNQGTEPVVMNGWSATDDPDDRGKWVFPNITLGPNQYLLVFASGKDRSPTTGNLHTNFNCSSEGEYLALCNAESPREVVSEISPRYPRQVADISYGLDGTGTYVYLETPTPGTANATGSALDGYVLEPAFSPRRGFYESPVFVTLTPALPGDTIRYTLDSSEPTPTRGTVYSSPINIAPGGGKGAVVVRAIAYRSGMLPSRVVTHTYLFPDAVMDQSDSPSGFPGNWNSQEAIYGMDSRVTNDPGHTHLVRNGLTSIPTLSISTHVDNLFDGSIGIYANPSREGVAWERPVSAELIYPDGTPGFEADCGLRIQGGSSTSNWKSKKVSMRILFKEDYGPEKLLFPLFPDTHVREFNTIVLDAHLNQTWNHPSHGQRVIAQYCRDQVMSDLQNAMSGYAPHDIFAHVYLNGLYWGLYDLHERPDAHFAGDYFGGNDDDYDVLKHDAGNVIDGTNQAWSSMMSAVRRDLSNNGNYLDVWDHIDVPNLIDYWLSNAYGGNTDWDHHNWYATHRQIPGSLWRIHQWDAEHVFKSLGESRVIGLSNSGKPTEIFQRLRANTEFRLLVADHVHRHFFNGGVLYVDPSRPSWDPDHPERNRAAELWMRRIEEVDNYQRRIDEGDPTVGSPISCESARWGDTYRPSEPYTRNDEFLTHLNWLLTTYFTDRSEVVLDQLRGAGLYPNVGAPVLSQHGGPIDPGFTLTMSRPSGTSGTIYYTTDGTDPRVFGSGSVSGSASAYTSALTLNQYTVVKARIRSGTDWSALTEAVFSLTDPGGFVRISEMMYHPAVDSPGDDQGDYEFIELVNIGATTVGLDGTYFSNGISFFFAPGTALQPGEHLVVVSNAQAFESRYPGVPYAGVYAGQLSNGGERVTLLDTFGNIIDSVEYDDDGMWPIGPDGFGYSLVLKDPPGIADDPSSWRASADAGGSPGEWDPTAPPGGVVINEVLANAQPPFEQAIELVNVTGSPRDIGGWYLSNSRLDEAALKRYRIPDGTLVPAGGLVVFYEYQFNATPGAPTSLSLDPAGGDVYLTGVNSSDELTGHIVEGSYGAEDSGISLGRVATSSGVDFASQSELSFGVSFPSSVEEFRTGTGALNGEPRFGPVVLNEIHYHPQGSGEEFIELFNPSGVNIPLYDNSLGRGWQVTGIQNSQETGSFEFGPGALIPAGGYLVVVVGVNPELFRTLHAVPGSVPIVGPAGGQIDNGGERIELMRPGEPVAVEVPYIIVDEVRYDDDDPWPLTPDGGGSSLERIFATSYGNDYVNWDASTRLGGTPGSVNTVSTPGENRAPKAIFTVSPPGGLAPVEVLLDASQSYDLDGEIVSYEWEIGVGTFASGRTVSHSFDTPGNYAVTLTVEDDEGARDSETTIVPVELDPGGFQLIGDANQDGALDISDGLKVLFLLFGGSGDLPCQGSDIASGGNLTVLDVNADSGVNLTDAVYILNYLFQGGPAPALGTDCQLVPGCPDVCAE